MPNPRHPRLFCLWLILPASLGLGGCGHRLAAEPGVVNYGNVFVGDQVTRSVVWTNHGPEDARLKNVKLQKPDQGFAIAAEGSGLRASGSKSLEKPVLLRQGDRSPEVRVRFTPDAYRTYASAIEPVTTDRGESESITLKGQGVYVKQIERLKLSAAGLSRSQPLDMGPTQPGKQRSHELTLTNLGSNALALTPHWRSGNHGLAIEDQPKTIRIPYGESKTINLTFAPKHQGIHTDTLKLTTQQDQVAGVVVVGVGKRK